MSRAKHTPRAFTLVEAIATMVVLAVVSAASSSVMWTAVHSFDQGTETARLHSEASVAMERMTRDLRAIPLNASGAPDISSMTAESITWDAGARSLELVGSDLVLTEGGVERVLLSDVSALGFQAYDASNLALATSLSGSACEPVRRLSLQITVTRGPAGSSVRTKVFLRCMMLEESQ